MQYCARYTREEGAFAARYNKGIMEEYVIQFQRNYDMLDKVFSFVRLIEYQS